MRSVRKATDLEEREGKKQGGRPPWKEVGKRKGRAAGEEAQ